MSPPCQLYNNGFMYINLNYIIEPRHLGLGEERTTYCCYVLSEGTRDRIPSPKLILPLQIKIETRGENLETIQNAGP